MLQQKALSRGSLHSCTVFLRGERVLIVGLVWLFGVPVFFCGPTCPLAISSQHVLSFVYCFSGSACGCVLFALRRAGWTADGTELNEACSALPPFFKSCCYLLCQAKAKAKPCICLQLHFPSLFVPLFSFFFAWQKLRCLLGVAGRSETRSEISRFNSNLLSFSYKISRTVLKCAFALFVLFIFLLGLNLGRQSSVSETQKSVVSLSKFVGSNLENVSKTKKVIELENEISKLKESPQQKGFLLFVCLFV
jgi:hypothetical protein